MYDNTAVQFYSPQAVSFPDDAFSVAISAFLYKAFVLLQEPLN